MTFYLYKMILRVLSSKRPDPGLKWLLLIRIRIHIAIVAGLDPYVSGPLGSGSVMQRTGSGSRSGSFYYHAKIVRKNLIPTIWWLFIFEKLCKCTFKKVISRKTWQKIVFSRRLEGQDPDPLVRGTDPRIRDPYQNVTDQQQCDSLRNSKFLTTTINNLFFIYIITEKLTIYSLFILLLNS